MLFCQIEKGELNPKRESIGEEVFQTDSNGIPHFHKRTNNFPSLQAAQEDALPGGDWEQIAEGRYEAITDTHYIELRIIRSH